MEIYVKGINNVIYNNFINKFIAAHPEHTFSRNFVKSADIILTESLSAEEAELFPSLKAVFAPVVGRNKFDLEQLADRRVESFFVAGTPEIVAEHALALALSLMGKIALHDRNLKQGDSWSFSDSYWDSLCAARIAILGTGRIGCALVGLLRPFGCKITGYHKNPHKVPPVFYDCLTSDLTQALSFTDVVFVTLDLNNETLNMIDEPQIELLRGKYLINVARAGIIREEALNAGLENNVLRGFASDVWYRYPESYPEGGMGKKDDLPPANYDFYKRDNVVCVPHTGTQTTKAREIYIRQTLNQLDDYLARF